MGKKHRQNPPSGPRVEAGEKTEEISDRGWICIGVGVLCLAAGFVVLSMTDPMGRNWAANLSPFLILGGYAVIGAGIFLPGSSELPPTVSEKTASTSESV